MSRVSGNPVICAGLVTFRLVCLGLHAPTGAPPANHSPSQSLTNQEAGLYLSASLLFREYSAVTKLYVGNLPFTATDAAVRTLFSTHGTVEKVSLITDRDTGRPRGFGFVEMSNVDASRAMQALNGTDFEGRPLKVSEAQDRQRAGDGPRRR
jgi:hypothetical protein